MYSNWNKRVDNLTSDGESVTEDSDSTEDSIEIIPENNRNYSQEYMNRVLSLIRHNAVVDANTNQESSEEDTSQDETSDSSSSIDLIEENHNNTSASESDDFIDSEDEFAQSHQNSQLTKL